MKYKLNHIYCEDCMEAMKQMPDKYFDLAIVDPPYGLGSTDFRSAKTSKIHKNKDWNNEIPPPEYFTQLRRVSEHQIIWGINYYTRWVRSPGRIVHYKELTPFIKNGKPTSECDLASQTYDRTVKCFHYQWSGNVQNGKINWDNSGRDGRIHPTQKPVALYHYCLGLCPGQKILDTHMGSGSIILACIDLGFDYMAFEIDKDYFEAAKKRIENHVKQQDFTRQGEAPTFVQKEIF